MTTHSDDREPVECLADEFLGRLRGGEHPSVEEFVARYPDQATEIRELLSALILVEDLKPRQDEASDRFDGARLGRDGQSLERLGDYRILSEVGRGGMGIVYEAEQESLGRRVALKVLAPWSRPNPQQILRFQREARSAAQLHHANIVPVFGVGEHEGMHYYAMQFIRGPGLDQILAEIRHLRLPEKSTGFGEHSGEYSRQAPDDPEEQETEIARTLVQGPFDSATPMGLDRGEELSPAARGGSSVRSSVPLPGHSELSPANDSARRYARSAARIVVQAAEAVQYAHEQGMLHRDIKPSNLLLDAHGHVWVTDFGLAKALDDDDLTRTGDIVGTIRYMAPERFRGHCDARSDVYALGLTLYEMLALRPAFEATDRNGLIHQITTAEPPPLRKLSPELPRDLETIVHKAIEKDPPDRYATAGAFAEDLRRWLGHETIRARPSNAAERLLKWTKRKPTLAALVLVSVLAAAALLATSTVGYVQVRRSLHRERRLSYFQRIALAERAWSSNDVGRAEELLDGCAPEFQGWEWHYLKRLCHSDLHAVKVHAGLEPNALGFSPDGALMATAGVGGTVQIWDATTGDQVRVLPGHEKGVYAVAFSPDGSRLASAGHDRAVQVWEVATGRPLFATPLRHAQAALSVAFSPDGSRLASCSGVFWETYERGDHARGDRARGDRARGDRAGELIIWDAASGRALLTLSGHDGSVHEVGFNPDGTLLASAGGDGTVKIWDTRTGAIVHDLKGHADAVQGIAYSPDGRRLASASQDGTVKIWDTAVGKSLHTLRVHDDRFFDVAFSPDGRRLAATGRSWVVTLWDAATGEKESTFRGHDREVTGVAFSPDGRRLASAGFDGWVRFWDATRDQEALALRGNSGAVVSVAFSRDSLRLAAAGERGPVWIRDAMTGRESLTLDEGAGDHSAVAFSPDGTLIAAGDRRSGSVSVRDAATGRVRLALEGHSGMVSAVAFSPDGRWLATGGADRTVRIWDLSSGRRRSSFVGYSLAITSLAFSPDGRHLATSTGAVSDIEARGEVTIRDVATGRVVHSLRGHDGGVSDLAFSPDGLRLATASWDRTVRIWDLATDLPSRTFGNRGLIVWAVAFSPDGRRLVAADNIGRMTFWETETGLEALTLRGHRDRIYDLAFSADGRFLASASRDGTAKIWDSAAVFCNSSPR